MKLHVHEIQDAGVIDLKTFIPTDQIVLDMPDHPVILCPIETNIHAEAFENDILTVVHMKAKMELSCSRCMDSYEKTLPVSFDMHTSIHQTYVDVLEEARQSLLLALPAKSLCQTNCQGLCPVCGKNLNTGACQCNRQSKESPFLKLKDYFVKDN